MMKKLLAITILGLCAACGGVEDDMTAEADSELRRGYSTSTTIDCKKKPDCKECGGSGPYCCFPGDDCDVINKPSRYNYGSSSYSTSTQSTLRR